MSFKIVVLAKQVPDTRNVGKDAMKADGTVNRAALPAIYNPEDLNALEQALRLFVQYFAYIGFNLDRIFANHIITLKVFL